MSMRGSRNEDRSEDFPPYSRLFIVCERSLTETDFREAFTNFGAIEDIRLPRDHKTGEPKGVVYIKFSKTSEAAAALEAMHQKVLEKSKRPLKVMVASNRSDIQSDSHEDDKRRLFITTDATEDDIYAVFEKYGIIESVQVQKNRETGNPKGFAYVKYRKFSDAAHAFEQCDKKYRAIFAAPKQKRRPETSFESNMNQLSSMSTNLSSIMSMMKTHPGGYNEVNFICSPHLTEMHIERLFDIVPGMQGCTYFVDLLRNFGKGTVSFSNPISAAYAVEKLNKFEYPPGQKIFVKPGNFSFESHEVCFNNIPRLTNELRAFTSSSNSTPDLAKLTEAVAEASKLIKLATAGMSASAVPDSNDLHYCSVRLPPPKPLADIDSPVAKRCFLVCKPQPPPLTVLRDIFCRFGDLINVYTLQNKTVGYARYASESSADEAIAVLHGAEVFGVRLKVLEAEPELESRKRRYNELSDRTSVPE